MYKRQVVTYLEGIRAFIPASQITLDYVEDTDAWIGKEIEVRVITVDPVSYTHLDVYKRQVCLHCRQSVMM